MNLFPIHAHILALSQRFFFFPPTYFPFHCFTYISHNLRPSLMSPAPNSPGYQYDTLQDNTRTIRLLSIQGEGDINCTLQTILLSEAPPYIALSYAWGPPQPTAIITLNCHPHATRYNLWTALKALSKHGVPGLDENRAAVCPRHFWMDYLCINQSDVGEKNHQVAMMKDVFSQARYVVAWLGEADIHSSDAIMDSANTTNMLGAPDTAQNSPVRDSLGKRLSEPFSYDDSLFKRPYWSRLWVVQEIMLARRVIFMCGSKGCGWFELSVWHHRASFKCLTSGIPSSMKYAHSPFLLSTGPWKPCENVW